ncbi:precorrin-2/cobalt-factor-2 C20-methyltransferase [Methanofervidicoccus abyssi]|uniref:Precorrin-2/cobalt-factor-2 C20-methyltransferase n=2 Tax=Methanofervidicoccus abyssi TaxID=2082189 RepID=A0A401HPE9_9EURY|nr:precorrin-2/cobalt-factor-2 C20-methyltransferase [Methanofervidicoccus abyssi]
MEYSPGFGDVMVEKVYGVGVGPGDKELLTLKAVKVLKKVDKIFIPVSKEGRSSLAYDIVKDIVEGKPVEELLFPMIKNQECLKIYHERAFENIKSAQGEVAVITIGDPTLYSTFSYLWRLLKRDNIPVEIVNGIPSPFACAGRLNIPLVEGREKLVILPRGEDLERYLGLFDTIVVMKTKRLGEILKRILGKEERDKYLVGVVSKGFWEDENIQWGKIEEIDFEDINHYLSLAIIKRVDREDI